MPDKGPDSQNSLQLSIVAIRVGIRWFGVPAETIREVLLKGPITRVPFTPSHVMGLCMVHGRVVPVVALHQLLALNADGPTALLLPRLVVLEVNGEELAFPCEEAAGVFTVAAPENVTKGITLGTSLWGDREIAIVNVPTLVTTALAHTKAHT